MNQIYLGQRAFGFAAAARTYFGKDLKDITLAEAAMLAGLPKAPSAYNPIVNPKRAHIRQQYILQRMLDVGFITQAQYDKAAKEELKVRAPGSQYTVHAEYVNEMVRQMVYAQYKEDTYTQGFNVYTTVNAADQQAAYVAVRKGVMDYDRRHGYRGPEETIELPANAEDRASAIDDVMDDHPTTTTSSPPWWWPPAPSRSTRCCAAATRSASRARPCASWHRPCRRRPRRKSASRPAH
jgi:penicillin-binding protein 1A